MRVLNSCKKILVFVLSLAAAGLLAQGGVLAAAETKAKPKTAAKTSAGKTGQAAFDKEKAAALANPYANDMTWLTEEERKKFLDQYEAGYVKGYSADLKEGYKLLEVKCAKCHEAVRPLNSQFLEPTGKDLAARQKAVAGWKTTDADVFKDKNVWLAEADVWQRYVKRMMAKPGCEISQQEGRKIWAFLAHDSSARKIGPKKEEWAKHRRGLLEEFKKANPRRYEELYAAGSSKKE
ncbi:MAG: hypothetical protein HY401_06950 [Elusimicrobia bacterium]|nr:hypothetical protein [Elusimicrobiota bacterium]